MFEKIKKFSFVIFAYTPILLIMTYVAYKISAFANNPIFSDTTFLWLHIPKGGCIFPFGEGGIGSHWVSLGRFWPLYMQEYNLLSFFDYFMIPENLALGCCIVNIILWCIFIPVFTLTLYKLTINSSGEKSKWYQWLALPLVIIALISQEDFMAYFIIPMYAEKMTVVLLALFALFYYEACRKNQTFFYVVAGVIALLATYCKESNFIFFSGIAGVNLLFSWKTLSRKHFIFLWFLVVNTIVFLILYYFLSFVKTQTAYNSSRFESYFDNILNVMKASPFFCIALVLGVFRLYKLIFKKERSHLWADSLLFSAIAFVIGYFFLKLFEMYYFSPVNVFFLAVFIYWAAYFKKAYIYAIFSIFMIFMFFRYMPFYKQIAKLECICSEDKKVMDELVYVTKLNKKIILLNHLEKFNHHISWRLEKIKIYIWFFHGNWRANSYNRINSLDDIFILNDLSKISDFNADETVFIIAPCQFFDESFSAYKKAAKILRSNGYSLKKSFTWSYDFFEKAIPREEITAIEMSSYDDVEGFYGKEVSGRWMSEKEAHIYIPLRNTHKDMLMTFEGFPFLSEQFRDNRMEIFINNRKIGDKDFSLNQPWNNAPMLIPESYLISGLNDLKFVLKDIKSPKELNINADSRKLGFHFTKLQLKERTLDNLVKGYPVFGFDEIEPTGRWSNEKLSGVKVWLSDNKQDFELTLEGFPFLCNALPANEMKILVNGKVVGVIAITGNVQRKIRIPLTALINGENNFEFQLKDIKSPKEVGINADSRKLGFHFTKLSLSK